MVTTAASPSGIAATAKADRHHKGVEHTCALYNIRIGRDARFNAENDRRRCPMTRIAEHLAQLVELYLKRRLASSFAWARASAILPISVSIPVAVTTACAAAIDHGAAHIHHIFPVAQGNVLSRPARFSGFDLLIVTGTDSPVSAASSTFMLAHSISRAVRRHCVASFQNNNVARNQLLAFDGDLDYAVRAAPLR